MEIDSFLVALIQDSTKCLKRITYSILTVLHENVLKFIILEPMIKVDHVRM